MSAEAEKTEKPPRLPLLLVTCREEVRAQAAKIEALQQIVSSQRRTLTRRAEEVEALRTEVARKDQSYAALALENEEHRARAKVADRLAAKADNLERALEVATKRCASLEESCRRLLAEHDARGVGHEP